ncbi:hypothetical protein COCC4DRAFT_152300 [Bipolaris maydis ATCC 48331]|uniref:Uncharacterized protein n=2 Tax=Cochliobolus heterostrophus TaxID=5016 RepID=M2UD75_COCH5|nr:uncharacterized protein COCC4DRAFT_152300 [Bipolaris maydis ATCC 48331]EMD85832.1 hypothetical protein COCHEDRAFT_1198770 [Bipolaris maydis C5]ENH99781.1 hypothetical protein COCC4DRAFT_152300 [Bipolaris maydis ATCC 48331]
MVMLMVQVRRAEDYTRSNNRGLSPIIFAKEPGLKGHGMNLPIAETRVAFKFSILGLVQVSDRYIGNGSSRTLS